MGTVEDDTPMDQSTGSNYMTIRTREFYGLGCDEWLTLVIKVSSSDPCLRYAHHDSTAAC